MPEKPSSPPPQSILAPAHNSLNLKNTRVGKLTIIDRAPNPDRKRSAWNCVCDCGARKSIRTAHLRNGSTVSCGCHRKRKRINDGLTNSQRAHKKKPKRSTIYYRKNIVRERERGRIYAAKRRRQINSDPIAGPAYRNRLNVWTRRHIAKRKASDPVFALGLRLRARILSALSRSDAKKSYRTMELVGCDIKFLRTYIESKFQPGMTWGNHGKGMGKWNIDHIRPCASFDLSHPVDQRRCFNFTNLQPLWAGENLSKSDKVPDSVFLLPI